MEEFNALASCITNDQLLILIHASLNLKQLNIAGCEKFSNTSWQFDEKACQQLEELTASGSNATINQLEALIKASPKLKIVHILNCTKINVMHIKYLNHCFPHITFIASDEAQQYFYLDGNVKLTNNTHYAHQLFQSRYVEFQPHPAQYRLAVHRSTKNQPGKLSFELQRPCEASLVEHPSQLKILRN